MNIEQVARICHEANRGICEGQGDTSQKPWDDAEDWQKESAKKGVWFCLEYPDAAASANHESWLAEKEATGWKYGPVKDAEKKEHPCFVPYDQLPPEQRVKDHVFRSIVDGCRPFVVAAASNGAFTAP